MQNTRTTRLSHRIVIIRLTRRRLTEPDLLHRAREMVCLFFVSLIKRWNNTIQRSPSEFYGPLLFVIAFSYSPGKTRTIIAAGKERARKKTSINTSPASRKAPTKRRANVNTQSSSDDTLKRSARISNVKSALSRNGSVGFRSHQPTTHARNLIPFPGGNDPIEPRVSLGPCEKVWSRSSSKREQKASFYADTFIHSGLEMSIPNPQAAVSRTETLLTLPAQTHTHTHTRRSKDLRFVLLAF